MKKENPNFYAIIPATVRYSKNLSANAKLMYGEITALCEKEGFCWASNNYFAELYNVSIKAVSQWINQLKEEKFIDVEINQTNNFPRKITIDKKVKSCGAVEQKVKSCGTKGYEAVEQKVKHNTIDSIIENNIVSTKVEASPKTFGNEEINSFYELIKKETGRPPVAGAKSRQHAYNFLRTLKKTYPDGDTLENARKIIRAALSLQDNWHSPKCHDPKHLFYNWGEITARVMLPKKETKSFRERDEEIKKEKEIKLKNEVEEMMRKAAEYRAAHQK